MKRSPPGCDLDIDRLRIGSGTLPTVPRRLPRHRPGEAFVKGPIPLSWLSRAASLDPRRGKTLAVGLAVWFEAGRKRRRTIALSASILVLFGVGRKAGYAALVRLEAAGLVTVERRIGKSPLVSLVEVSRDEQTRPE